MKVIILAAGYATRLYPLTENFPKPLLAVGKSTIIDRLIDDVKDCADEIIVVTNHKFADIFSKWSDGRYTIIDDGSLTNDTRLGAVKDISLAVSEKDEEYLVMAGDNVLDFSLKDFISYAKDKKASCVMRHFEGSTEKLKKTGVLSVSDDGRVLKMEEKPPQPESNWACPPFYYYRGEDILRIDEALKEGCGYDAPGSFVAWLCKRENVYAWEMTGHRYDIGNLQSYEETKKRFEGEDNNA